MATHECRRVLHHREPPGADPHAGWCGGRELATPAYPILQTVLRGVLPFPHTQVPGHHWTDGRRAIRQYCTAIGAPRQSVRPSQACGTATEISWRLRVRDRTLFSCQARTVKVGWLRVAGDASADGMGVVGAPS